MEHCRSLTSALCWTNCVNVVTVNDLKQISGLQLQAYYRLADMFVSAPTHGAGGGGVSLDVSSSLIRCFVFPSL